MSMLKLAGIGNLGKDAEVKQVSGKTVINFNFAHTNSYVNGQGVKIENTQWVECAYWTEKTGIAPYLKKGQQVYVEGSIEVATYAKNDGSTGVSLRCRVGMVQLCGTVAQATQNMAAPAAYVPPATGYQNPIDNLPF